ncbi:MAG: hypothetical protein HYY40_05545 [Bacteroidetes bacterium]|nr:hypothetical protein [Bacteroidota bacterium]
MKILFINCKEATLFVLRKEEGKTTAGDNFRLALHLLLCKFCAIFSRQSAFIAKQVKRLHSSATLSGDDLLKMKRSLGIG